METAPYVLQQEVARIRAAAAPGESSDAKGGGHPSDMVGASAGEVNAQRHPGGRDNGAKHILEVASVNTGVAGGKHAVSWEHRGLMREVGRWQGMCGALKS